MKSELNYVKQYFVNQFGESHAKYHINKLKEYLNANISLERVTAEIRTEISSSSKIHLIHYLFGIAGADQTMTGNELRVIKQIAINLGLHSSTFDSILAMYYYQNGDHQGGNYRNREGLDRSKLTQAYEIIGVASSATTDEVKKAFRKLAIKHHPDKVAQLGTEFQKGAKDKFQQIQSAYELIKKSRGIK